MRFDYGRIFLNSIFVFPFTLSELTDGVLATGVGWVTGYAISFGNIWRLCFAWDD